MAEIWLTVDEQNQVSEEEVHVESGDKVFWEPAAGLTGEVVIAFNNKRPFKDLKWFFNKKQKGKKVSGKVKGDVGGYYYAPTFVPSRGKGKVDRPRKKAQPQIIVDGLSTRKTASKTSRAKASLPKAATRSAAAKRVAKMR